MFDRFQTVINILRHRKRGALTVGSDTEPVKFQVTFEGELMSQQSLTFSWQVNPAAPPPPPPTPLTFTSPVAPVGGIVPLPAETVGTVDDDPIGTVAGGTPPYNVAVSSGSLPSGNNITSNPPNADGSQDFFISGTPDGANGTTGQFTLTATDSQGATAQLKKG